MEFSQIRTIAQEGKLDRPRDYYSLSYLLHRRISIYISAVLARISPPLTPNMVTLAAIVLSIAGCIMFATFNSSAAAVVALLMCYLSFLFDKVDGELARLRNIITYRGKYLDEIYHFIQPLLYTAVAIRFGGESRNIVVSFLIIMLLTWGRFRIQLTRPSLVRFTEGHKSQVFAGRSGLFWMIYKCMRFLVRYDVVLIQIVLLSFVLRLRYGMLDVVLIARLLLFFQLSLVVALEFFATMYDIFVRTSLNIAKSPQRPFEEVRLRDSL